jgi:hypothetical protein
VPVTRASSEEISLTATALISALRSLRRAGASVQTLEVAKATGAIRTGTA